MNGISIHSWVKAWATTFRFRHTLLEMLVALSLAFLVWLYTHSRAQDSIDRVQIPVLIQLAPQHRDQFVLETSGSPNVTVTFTGPSSRVRELRHKLQRGQVQAAVTLNLPEDRLSETTFCENVRIEASHLGVPAGILTDLADDRCSIPVTVQRLSERQLPVKFDFTGDVRVTQTKIEPATVLVRGPKQILDHLQAIQTQPYALTVPSEGNADGLVRGQAALVSELDGRAVLSTPRVISFKCKVQPRQKIYELAEVPVQFLCPPQFPWRARFADEKAGKVKLRLLGPAGEEVPPVLAFVDLTGNQLFRGRNLEPLRLQLPKDFTLVESTPPVIPFYLEELERPTPTSQSTDNP
jgi:hypothetical protein